MILDQRLNSESIVLATFPLPDEILTYLKDENWYAIDTFFVNAEKSGGLLYRFMENYLQFKSIEHIVAIRSSPDDEDGIWHDDGSRILGFSLSLNLNPDEIKGGELLFRQKESSKYRSIPPQQLGQIILFKTGIYGYEHKVTAVLSGRRIVVAGWCS